MVNEKQVACFYGKHSFSSCDVIVEMRSNITCSAYSQTPKHAKETLLICFTHFPPAQNSYLEIISKHIPHLVFPHFVFTVFTDVLRDAFILILSVLALPNFLYIIVKRKENKKNSLVTFFHT